MKECSCISQDNGLYDLGCPVHDHNKEHDTMTPKQRSLVIEVLIKHAKSLGW